MNKDEWDLKDFKTETVTLKELYLSRAIEDFAIAQKYNKFVLNSPNNIVKQRYALSSLIFSFLSIEILINYYYKELFVHASSKLYVSETDRSFLLKQHISCWRNLKLIDKYKTIHYVLSKIEPSPSLIGKLSEFNNYRNLIVHGYCFQRDLLLSTTYGDDWAAQDIFDYEDLHEGKPWENRFPLLKFNSPDSIWIEDAQKGLTVMLECMAPILKAAKEEFYLMLLHPVLKVNTLNYSSCNIDYILARIPEEINV